MVPFQPAIQGCPWIYIVSCLILVIIYNYALKKCSSMFRLALASALLAALPIILTHSDKSIANDNSSELFNDFLKRFLLLNLKLESFRILTLIKSLCLRKGILSFFFDKEDTEFLFNWSESTGVQQDVEDAKLSKPKWIVPKNLMVGNDLNKKGIWCVYLETNVHNQLQRNKQIDLNKLLRCG